MVKQLPKLARGAGSRRSVDLYFSYKHLVNVYFLKLILANTVLSIKEAIEKYRLLGTYLISKFVMLVTNNSGYRVFRPPLNLRLGPKTMGIFINYLFIH